MSPGSLCGAGWLRHRPGHVSRPRLLPQTTSSTVGGLGRTNHMCPGTGIQQHQRLDVPQGGRRRQRLTGGLLPGLGNERLDPLHLLLLLLQLLWAQGRAGLQVNVPLRDEDFVRGGELWRNGCRSTPFYSPPTSPPPSPTPRCPLQDASPLLTSLLISTS